MGIDPRRLRSLTEEVDDLHHDSMRTIRDEFAEVHFGEIAHTHGPTRRSFLKLVAAGGALTAGSQFLPLGRLVPAAWAQDGDGPDDGEIAAFAQSLELAAAAAYGAVIDTGKLTEPIAEVARLFGSHHAQHAEAIGGLLGNATVEDPNAKLLAEFTPRIRAAADQDALLELALGLEESAAATYYTALGTLEQTPAKAVATILPVESQHAVVLATVLDKPMSEYLPVEQTEATALRPADYPLPADAGDDGAGSPTTLGDGSTGGGGGGDGGGDAEGGDSSGGDNSGGAGGGG